MTKRLSINISDSTAAKLDEIARADGVTVTEVVRRAILTERFLRDEQKAGREILLEDTEGVQRRVVFL